MFRFFGKCMTLPDLKIKSKIYFGVKLKMRENQKMLRNNCSESF